MAEYVELADPVRRGGKWWVPACPPHFEEDCGPYDTEGDAWDDLNGMERTINTPAWRSMMMDLEEGILD